MAAPYGVSHVRKLGLEKRGSVVERTIEPNSAKEEACPNGLSRCCWCCSWGSGPCSPHLRFSFREEEQEKRLGLKCKAEP